MKYTRKIKILPKKKTKKSGIIKPLSSNLDEAIRQVLKQKSDDRTKWNMYQDALQRFLYKPKKDILDTLPERYKARAVRILDSLNGKVTWTHDGTVSVNGIEIPNSHVAELVEAYLNPSKRKPIGWLKFKSLLPVETKDAESQWEKWTPKKTRKRTK